jgi:hypothetical protein
MNGILGDSMAQTSSIGEATVLKLRAVCGRCLPNSTLCNDEKDALPVHFPGFCEQICPPAPLEEWWGRVGSRALDKLDRSVTHECEDHVAAHRSKCG